MSQSQHTVQIWANSLLSFWSFKIRHYSQILIQMHIFSQRGSHWENGALEGLRNLHTPQVGASNRWWLLGEGSQLSLRVWPLVGWPCSGRRPHIQEGMDSIYWIKGHNVGRTFQQHQNTKWLFSWRRCLLLVCVCACLSKQIVRR